MILKMTTFLRMWTCQFVLSVVVWTAFPLPNCQAFEDSKVVPFPGERTQWNGFARFDFKVDGKPVLVVAPDSPADGRPWVWHGEFFGHKPDPDIALLKRGYHIVYMTVPDMLGSPRPSPIGMRSIGS